MDPTVIEKRLRRIAKHFLTAVARCCILASFLADALHLCQSFKLERILLNATWHCGPGYAAIYIGAMILTQLAASLMMICDWSRHIGAGILCLMAHMRLAANPAFWTLELYVDTCALISAVLLAMLKPRRSGCMAFLFMAYLTYKQMDCWIWRTFHRYLVKFLIAFVIVGYRLRSSAALLIVLISAHMLYAYAWWNVPYDQIAVRNLKRFHFWHKFSILGGLLMTALHGNYRLHIG